MHECRPDQHTVLGAITLANRAPSLHNAQPWHWLIGDTSIHLMAGQPPATGPLLGCGAALHHLRVAFAALGWRTIVHRLPNPGEATHLAAVEFARHTPSTEDIVLAGAISRRRTDRRRFSSLPVPAGHVILMAVRAAKAGARLTPALSLVGAGAPGTQDDETGELLALTTATDDLVSVLRAGEAASAALLTTTSLGLATRALSPAPDVAECPLLVLRTGWAPAAAPAPPRTPRRTTADTVGYLPGTRHGYPAAITMKSPWPP
jgi:hypothetical protein